jgi:hypothetical protein
MGPQIQILHTGGFAEILAIVRFRIVNSDARFFRIHDTPQFQTVCNDSQFLAADATETPADSSPPERNFALAVSAPYLPNPSHPCGSIVKFWQASLLP